jgi:Coenzyme PQQ synthesis protein D (PqqD)
VHPASRHARGPDEAVELVRTSSCVTRAIAGETLIIPIARATADLESIFTLNAVGSRIWELLESPVTPPRLVATITREFEVSESDAARDVAEFLESLHAAGLIAPVEG